MSVERHKIFGYTKVTNLTDDFRRFQSNTPLDLDYSWEVDNCPICLDVHDEQVVLGCNHKYCKVCLQYTIDKTLPNTRYDDRGFVCAVCGYFTKVPNYSVKRNEWASNLPEDFRFQTKLRNADSYTSSYLDESYQNTRPERLVEDNWFVKWKISTFPKSYLINRGLNPYKRLRNRYVFEYIPDVDSTHEDVHNKQTDEGRLNEDENEGPLISKITVATFYNDSVIVYDEGLHEIQIYNEEMTLVTCVKETGIFDIAVLNTTLYMTVPEERCLHVYNLENKCKEGPLYLTAKCYGVCTFDENLAVLLCDKFNQRYEVCFIQALGVCGEKIELMGGRFDFKSPRQLAVCPITRLAYVCDEEAGLVKCFRLDGRLNWERLAYGAGSLALFNGYLLVARGYTCSIDVLVSGGRFNGRLQSFQYELFEPQCIVVESSRSEIVVVDGNNLIHLFTLRRRGDEFVQKKKGGRFCHIL